MNRPRLMRFGLLAALLALSAQLAFGAAVPQPALGEVGFGIICHSGTNGAAPTQPGHHAPDCALCPLCVALAMPGPTLTAPPPMPVPGVVVVLASCMPPPQTGPPYFPVRSARPRGPPSLA